MVQTVLFLCYTDHDGSRQHAHLEVGALQLSSQGGKQSALA